MCTTRNSWEEQVSMNKTIPVSFFKYRLLRGTEFADLNMVHLFVVVAVAYGVRLQSQIKKESL